MSEVETPLKPLLGDHAKNANDVEIKTAHLMRDIFPP